MDLIEKMARAAYTRFNEHSRQAKAETWEYQSDRVREQWRDFTRAGTETILTELPEKSTGIGQRSPDYVRGFNEARNVIVNALAPKDSPNGR